mmetsp:Transcript_22367/g.46396  ORF Transcript_22367/g.46396 Transcript_22367/m.46396 type:complete len:457 (+) Transcript_22367:62-1432(+)
MALTRNFRDKMPLINNHRLRFLSLVLIVTMFSLSWTMANTLTTGADMRRGGSNVVRMNASNLGASSSLFGRVARCDCGRTYLSLSTSSDIQQVSSITSSIRFPPLNKRLVSFTLSNIAMRLAALCKFILKSLAISFFVTMSLSSPRPAFATSKTSNSAVAASPNDPMAKSDRCLKVIVTTASVAAGAAAAHKVRILNRDGDHESNATISAEPATSENSSDATPTDITAGTAEKLNSDPIPPKKTIASKYNKTNNSSSPLVKDLDAKIERLKEQEKLALDAAEKVKADNLAKEDEERKRRDAVAAQIERAALEEAKKQAEENEKSARQEAELRAAEEKATQESRDREKADEEKWRLEQIAKSHSMDVEKLEKLVSKEDTKPAGSSKSSLPRDVEWARKQPKSPQEEQELKEKYGSMEIEERAFNILVDLGMVELNPDPAPIEWEENDDSDDSENVFL